MAYINLGQVMYPIGAYYFSNNATSPSALFGGTWTLVDAGTFICGANSTDWPSLYKGGHNWLTLAASQMPKHSHYVKWSYTTIDAASGTGANYLPGFINWNDNPNMVTNIAGGSQAFDNKPQYISAFIWYRTA